MTGAQVLGCSNGQNAVCVKLEYCRPHSVLLYSRHVPGQVPVSSSPRHTCPPSGSDSQQFRHLHPHCAGGAVDDGAGRVCVWA